MNNNQYQRINSTHVVNTIQAGGIEAFADYAEDNEIQSPWQVEQFAIRGMVYREGAFELFKEFTEATDIATFLRDQQVSFIDIALNKVEGNAYDSLFIKGEFSYTRLSSIVAELLTRRAVKYATKCVTNPKTDFEKQTIFRGFSFSDTLWDNMDDAKREARIYTALNAASLGLRVVAAGLLSTRESANNLREYQNLSASIYDIVLPLASQSIKRFPPQSTLTLQAAYPPELGNAIENLANGKRPNFFELISLYQDLRMMLETVLFYKEIDGEMKVEFPDHISNFGIENLSPISESQSNFLINKVEETRSNLLKANSKKAWRNILELTLSDLNIYEPISNMRHSTITEFLGFHLKLSNPIRRLRLISEIDQARKITTLMFDGKNVILNPNFVETTNKGFKLKEVSIEKDDGNVKKALKILWQIWHPRAGNHSLVSNTENAHHTGCLGLVPLQKDSIDASTYELIEKEMEQLHGKKPNRNNINAVSMSSFVMQKIAMNLDPQVCGKFEN
jgi:hypothetical protein